MKKIIQFKLKILAKMILARYKPDVIGITGSVGKTSAKEAVYAVLASKFNARRNIKNYNNEIGLPLTVIGADSPGKSVFGWLAVFLKALKLILIRDANYPRILILEMGVDRPGDMDYLNSIVKCKI
ncbi:MAG: Mur ligase family protein, partial [bacterium]|nr:Mur ligase family protein [bacterium]